MNDLKVGDMVVYVDYFDADDSYSPNIGPAIVTKVHPNTPLVDLCVFSQNGVFYKLGCKESMPQELKRGTFYRR